MLFFFGISQYFIAAKRNKKNNNTESIYLCPRSTCKATTEEIRDEGLDVSVNADCPDACMPFCVCPSRVPSAPTSALCTCVLLQTPFCAKRLSQTSYIYIFMDLCIITNKNIARKRLLSRVGAEVHCEATLCCTALAATDIIIFSWIYV